jgi:hypothetical protein
MDYHNNAVGRIYVKSVAESKLSIAFLGIIPYRHIVTPSENTMADYLAAKARNESFYIPDLNVDLVKCALSNELIYIYCPDLSSCNVVVCNRPEITQTATIDFKKPRAVARVISNVATVLLPTPPCPLPPFPFTPCIIWKAKWHVTTKIVTERTINLFISDIPSAIEKLVVNCNTVTIVATPSKTACTDGTTVAFVNWEGSGAQYLANRYESHTTITVPIGIRNIELMPVYR